MPIRAAQSCYKWLPITAGWIYRQMECLPKDQVESWVVCERLENLPEFPWPHIEAPSPCDVLYMAERVGRRIGFRGAPSRLSRAIRRSGLQLVHSHFGDRGWLDVPAVRKNAIKQVVTFYGQDVNRLPVQQPIWRGRYKELFAEVHQVLCEGSFMRDALLALGADPARTRVQHLGVDVEKIRFQARSKAPDEPLKVLMAASFTEKKGLPDAIEALGRLHNELHVPLEFTLIGDARSEPEFQLEKQRILAAIDKWHLQPFARLLGYRPYAELFAEAYRHHVFLSPSRMASDGDTEGGAPVSLIDMQATGMPIVSTTHCDIPEVVRHGVTGLLAGEGDIDGIVACLHQLAQAPDTWAKIGAAGRRHVEQEYDSVRQGQRLAEIYRGVVAG